MKNDTLLVVLGLAAAGVVLYMLLSRPATNPAYPYGIQGGTPAIYGGGGIVTPTGYAYGSGYTPVPTINPTIAAVGAGTGLIGTVGSLFASSPSPVSVPTGVGNSGAVTSYQSPDQETFDYYSGYSD